MISKLGRLFVSEGFRQASLVTFGNIGATAVAAVAMIIFSRVLGPTQFGVFSSLFSLLLIMSKLGDLGINIAVQRYVAGHDSDPTACKKAAQTGSAFKLYLSLAIALIGIIFGDYMASLLHLPQASFFVKLVFVLSGTVVFYEYVTTLLQAKSQFGYAVITNWIQSSGKLLFGILLSIFGVLSIGSSISLYLILPAIAAWFGMSKLPKSFLTPKTDYQVARTLGSVIKWTSISIISASIADNIDILIIQNMLTPTDTGLWSSAVRIATLASLIGWSLGSVLNIRVAKYKDKLHLDKYLKKAVVLSLISAVVVFAMIPFSRLLLTLTVGPDYALASFYLTLLFLSTAVLTATSPFTALFYVFDRPEYFAIVGIISSVLLISGDLLLIPIYGVAGAGYARIIMRLVIIIFTLVYSRYAYRQKYGK